MWEFFEPDLRKRFGEMEVDESFTARVRSALVERIPGECATKHVAGKLGMSKWILQRKLSEESTTFEKQLNYTRELIAKNYLQNTDLPLEDIAFFAWISGGEFFLSGIFPVDGSRCCRV